MSADVDAIPIPIITGDTSSAYTRRDSMRLSVAR